MRYVRLGSMPLQDTSYSEAPDESPPLILSSLALLAMGIGGVLLATLQVQLEHIPWLAAIPASEPVLEHAASALIVAAVIGFSYERILHNYREATFRRLFREHRTKTFDALKAYLSLKPVDVFRLIRDITTQTHSNTGKIPTLYHPARNSNQEYTFAASAEYFDALVEVGHSDLVDILREWIAPQSPASLKFLASDFVGRYRLSELRDELFAEAHDKLRRWERLGDEERWCALNYFWAASRCESRPYKALTALIKYTPDAMIREWILFVPQQMRDKEFLSVIIAFLRRPDPPSTEEMKLAVVGLAELQPLAPRQVQDIFSRYSPKFRSSEITDKIKETWIGLGRSPGDVLKRIGPLPSPPGIERSVESIS